MGTTSSSTSLSNFDSAPYIQPGISEKEVYEIKNNFEMLEPKNGFVKISKIREQYKYSIEKNNLDSLFGDRVLIDFNEFFRIMAAEIIYTRSKYIDVEFDNLETANGCILCGTGVDKRKKYGNY